MSPLWLAKENSLNVHKLIDQSTTRSDLLPLERKWSCICAGKDMYYTQYECVMRNTGICFVSTVLDVVAFGVAEAQLSINRERMSIMSSSSSVSSSFWSCASVVPTEHRSLLILVGCRYALMQRSHRSREVWHLQKVASIHQRRRSSDAAPTAETLMFEGRTWSHELGYKFTPTRHTSARNMCVFRSSYHFSKAEGRAAHLLVKSQDMG